MSSTPPNCFICEKDLKNDIEKSYYCICDITICDTCINSVKKNESTWICPQCKKELPLEKSRLFRNE